LGDLRGGVRGEVSAPDAQHSRRTASTKSLGFSTGTYRRNLTLVDADYDADTKLAQLIVDTFNSVADTRDRVEVTYVLGDMYVRDGGAVISVRGISESSRNKMAVQADDAGFSSAKIAAHELGHHLFQRGYLNRGAVFANLRSAFAGRDTLDVVRKMYVAEYPDLPDIMIIEELLCDALGKMNLFADEPGVRESVQQVLEVAHRLMLEDLSANRRSGSDVTPPCGFAGDREVQPEATGFPDGGFEKWTSKRRK